MRSVFKKVDAIEVKDNVYEVSALPVKKVNVKLEAKRQSKNRDAIQQSFLIKKLHECGFDITIAKLYKKGMTTMQLFRIKRILYHGVEYFNERKLVFNGDMKMVRRDIDAYTNNTLLDLLQQNKHVVMKEKKLKEGTKSVGMRRFNRITIDDESFDGNTIESIGKEVYAFILNHVVKDDFELFSTDRM